MPSSTLWCSLPSHMQAERCSACAHAHTQVKLSGFEHVVGSGAKAESRECKEGSGSAPACVHGSTR